MGEIEPWCFTVVRAHGMRLMRPGKTWQSWRPIITVEIDEHHCHETVMGIDGQNPNLKERFELRQADHTSKIDIRVWHRSQSKKKTKKRTLVASASHSLGELLRQQEKEPREDPEELELRLHCQSASKSIASKGRPQNGATVLLKIHAPPNVRRDLDLTQADQNESHEDWGVGSSSGAGSSTRVSEPSESMPPSPTDDNWPDLDGTLTSLRRRRHRHSGYNINSDDNEDYSASASDDDDAPTKRLLFSDGEEPYDYEPSEHVIRVSSSGPGEWIQSIWPAILPQYTERIEVHLELTFIERVLASFTTYSALKAAHTDRDYEQVFTRLQMEWTYVGGLLVAMAAVSTAVFAIGPGSVFNVQSYACTSIAASSISSGLGIATDAWFLLRYNWADLHTFKTRARDIYASYFFFALSARVPVLCLFASAVTLMIFLGLVAFEVWPLGVMITCFAIGVVMGLQFLVFGAHWCVLRVLGVGRWVGRCGRWVLGVGRGREGKHEGRGEKGDGDGDIDGEKDKEKERA